MSRLLRFPSSIKRDPDIDTWMQQHPGELGAIAQRWFAIMRNCGDDVREPLHDGHPTACVGDAALLKSVGFVDRGGRGSHRNFVHSNVRKSVTISGKLGDDAKHYQVRAVRLALEGLKK